MNDLKSKVTDDLARARHISDLIVNCCQMNSARNLMNELAFVLAVYRLADKYIPYTTGSCAELYIDPGKTCIGDVDLMYTMKDHIVVCDGSVVDSIDVNETVEVYRIETSDCPIGYVHLRSFGQLQFNWETEQFEYRVSNNTWLYFVFNKSNYEADIFHGPAAFLEGLLSDSTTMDLVPCIRLLAWPPVAQSWISRERQHSWPCDAIVSEVQRNGCDLVFVSHQNYKNDSRQFRYSFSRAEVTLIRSWTPVQQLVYHMLRYFTKQAIIREADDKVVCTYHIKTLMLWACERKSLVWWESSCVLVLCSNLLDTLIRWIRKKKCPHYFIPDWNLFDYKMQESRRLYTIETLRIHLNIRTLSEWFRIEYLSKVFEEKKNLLNFDELEHQHALNTIAALNRSSSEFRKFYKNGSTKDIA